MFQKAFTQVKEKLNHNFKLVPHENISEGIDSINSDSIFSFGLD